MSALRETGSVPGDENGRKKGDESVKKKKRADKAVRIVIASTGTLLYLSSDAADQYGQARGEPWASPRRRSPPGRANDLRSQIR